MNNPLYSFVAWVLFLMLAFFGLVMCFTSLALLSEELSGATVMAFWSSFWFGVASVWLGWWIKRAVTGRKGLVWGWNWEWPLSVRTGGKSALNGKASMFRWQALFLAANILTPIGLAIVVA